jgi:serine/threonine protein kinase
MSEHNCQSVEDLFQRATGLAPHERDRLIVHTCSEDRDSQHERESLSAEDESKLDRAKQSEQDAFERLDLDTTRSKDQASKKIGPSDTATIGPYRLLEVIGRGGMGEIWLAEQKHPVRRRIALKLIKPGMDTREVVARFESERQALALMDHPAIAKVFDAGSTEQNRPYFAMEYVAGIPITTYCDKHKLTVQERLQLFIQVCEGVQHAHQKAIIHRDLKPSNIAC